MSGLIVAVVACVVTSLVAAGAFLLAWWLAAWEDWG